MFTLGAVFSLYQTNSDSPLPLHPIFLAVSYFSLKCASVLFCTLCMLVCACLRGIRHMLHIDLPSVASGRSLLLFAAYHLKRQARILPCCLGEFLLLVKFNFFCKNKVINFSFLSKLNTHTHTHIFVKFCFLMWLLFLCFIHIPKCLYHCVCL